MLALLLVSSSVSAQATADVVAGFAYTHPEFENVHLSAGDSLKGWLGAVDVPIGGHWGVTARADGAYGERFQQGVVIRPLGTSVRSTIYTVSGGPRVSVTRASLTAFADGLFGVAHGTAGSALIDFLAAVDDTKFVGGGGGGVAVHLARRVDLQLDVQYRRTHLFDQTLNMVQVGAGLVLPLARR
jgi:outer membrane protein with beta-barrel domain